MSEENKLMNALEIMNRIRETIAMNTQKNWKKPFIVLCVCGLLMSFSSLAMAKNLKLEINEAEKIHFDGDVSEIFIANPEIADVQLANPHVAYVYGKTPGTTTLFASNKKGKTLLELEVPGVFP